MSSPSVNAKYEPNESTYRTEAAIRFRDEQDRIFDILEKRAECVSNQPTDQSVAMKPAIPDVNVNDATPDGTSNQEAAGETSPGLAAADDLPATGLPKALEAHVDLMHDILGQGKTTHNSSDSDKSEQDLLTQDNTSAEDSDSQDEIQDPASTRTRQIYQNDEAFDRFRRDTPPFSLNPSLVREILSRDGPTAEEEAMFAKLDEFKDDPEAMDAWVEEYTERYMGGLAEVRRDYVQNAEDGNVIEGVMAAPEKDVKVTPTEEVALEGMLADAVEGVATEADILPPPQRAAKQAAPTYRPYVTAEDLTSRKGESDIVRKELQDEEIAEEHLT
jgi:hypothetical protein